MEIENSGAQRTFTLPEETIEEILSRLPPKSLLRFRCVAKSWWSLIGSKRFINKHLQNSTTNTSLAHRRVLLASRRSFSRRATLSQCSLLSLFNKPDDVDALVFNFPTKVRVNSISLVGCCNGLVCVVLNSKHFILWNPSTRISKKLPRADDNMRLRVDTACYGFGYDESSGDYKVFWLVKSVCKLYSLKSDSWKTTNVWDLPLRCFGRGKFAGGKLHWKATYTQVETNSSDYSSYTEEENISSDSSDAEAAENISSEYSSDTEEENISSDSSDAEAAENISSDSSEAQAAENISSDSDGSDSEEESSSSSDGSDSEEESSSSESSDTEAENITGPGYIWDIVAFDMNREVYGTVEQPRYSEGKFRPFLGKLGECLAVLCSYETGIDVWIMKESWVKGVALDDVGGHPWRSPSLIPFCIGPEGEMLLMQEGSFLIYYHDNWFKQVGVGRLNSSSEADIYVESLVQLESQTVRDK